MFGRERFVLFVPFVADDDSRSASDNFGSDSANVGKTTAVSATLFLADKANTKVR